MFCLKFCQVPTKKKSSSTSTKDLFGKFPENSQDYKEKKGRSCHIWRLDCCKSLELGRCLRGRTSCPINDSCHLVWDDVSWEIHASATTWGIWKEKEKKCVSKCVCTNTTIDLNVVFAVDFPPIHLF